MPLAYLGRNTVQKAGRTHYPVVSDFSTFLTDPSGLYIARGIQADALVLSHDCEIDKGGRHPKVIVAPIFSEEAIPLQDRASIMAGGRRAFLPLPHPKDGPNSFVDLRQINFVFQSQIEGPQRLASMTEPGVLRLRAQLVEFFTRVPADTFSAQSKTT
jgi:hypothetical protein